MPVLHFKGKPFLKSYHHTVEFHRLVEQPKKSLTDSPSLNDNLIIHGDNLKALKALLPTHAGKIKCIYIDPPYNTGNESWAYNDNVNSPMIQKWLGQVVAKDDLSRHDKWCCMMYPRLVLLRELLRDDGVIFVSIDDNEAHHLRMMLDEIFGEDNCVAQFVWRRRQNPDSRNESHVSIDHEYLLSYARQATNVKFRGVQIDSSKYKNPDSDARGHWASIDLSGLATKEQRPNLHFDIIDPGTGNVYPPNPKRGWSKSRTTIDRMIEENRILFPTKPSGRPREKKFIADLLKEVTGLSSWLNSVTVSFTTNGTREVSEIFGEKIFDFPKPTSLVKSLVNQITNKDDIILDSFAGSGTTGHAVLDLNKENGGNRKFILVECEDYADDITAERLRRVIKGVPSAKDEKLRNGLGGSFSYYELGDPISTDTMLDGTDLPSFADLAKYAFHTATGEKLDLKELEPKDYYVGSSKTFEVFLIYEPDKERLKELALNLALAEKFQSRFPGRRKLVYAPCCYLEDWRLGDFNISFAQLPFEIYRIAA